MQRNAELLSNLQSNNVLSVNTNIHKRWPVTGICLNKVGNIVASVQGCLSPYWQWRSSTSSLVPSRGSLALPFGYMWQDGLSPVSCQGRSGMSSRLNHRYDLMRNASVSLASPAVEHWGTSPRLPTIIFSAHFRSTQCLSGSLTKHRKIHLTSLRFKSHFTLTWQKWYLDKSRGHKSLLSQNVALKRWQIDHKRHSVTLKSTKIVFGRGSGPDLGGGAYNALSGPHSPYYRIRSRRLGLVPCTKSWRQC